MQAAEPCRAARRPLLAVFAAALAVRVATAFAFHAVGGPAALMGPDSTAYLAMAAQFAADAGRGTLAGWDWLGPDTGLMPAYLWFLVALTAIAPDSVAVAAGLAQAAVDAGTCVAVAALAGRLDRRLLLPAGLFAAVNPTMTVMSVLVYTDTLFTFGCALALLGATRWGLGGAWRAALLLGAGLGLAALTRALILPWAAAVLILLVGWAAWRRDLGWRRCGQLVAAGTLCALFLAPMVARNMDRYDALAVSSQGGAHVLLWLVPLTMEVVDGTSHADGAALMQQRYQAEADPAEADNPFARSAGMASLGFRELAELGPSAVLGAWAYGAAINLAAPAVVQAPLFQQLPRTGFYATPGSGKLEKIRNFLFRNDNPTYAWLMLGGIAGILVLRALQLWGLAAGLGRGDNTAPALLLLIAWCGFILAVNGPIAAPKYRLPMEPALAVFFALGVDAFRRRFGRGPGR